MQAHAFPRTSGAKNPIVILKIFIFILLQLKVVLQAKLCKGRRCNLEGWSRLLQISQTHKKLHLSACRGCYNLGKHVFACNSHTVGHTFKNLVSPDSLNGAESLCVFHLERFFFFFFRKITKTGKPTFTLGRDEPNLVSRGR